MRCSRCGSELAENQSMCWYCRFFILKSSSRGLLTEAYASSIELVSSSYPLLEADLTLAKTAFSPGSVLCRGRYVLNGQQTFQPWADNAYEIHWLAQDLFQEGAKVIVCEMELPAMKVLAKHASLRAAMKALFLASRSPQV